MTDDLGHRALRELLGAHALGALPPEAQSPLLAHLDGCASCREELAGIAPLAADLAALDVSALGPSASPPPALGERIRAAVADERRLVEARSARDRTTTQNQARSRRARQIAGVAAAAVLVLTGGALVGRVTAPPAAPPVPIAAVDLREAGGLNLDVTQAGVINHTWGAEVRFTGSGFTEGEVFRAAFRMQDGSLLPAGEFLGTGERRLVCNMQAALLLADAVEFVVSDAEGTTVLAADLEQRA